MSIFSFVLAAKSFAPSATLPAALLSLSIKLSGMVPPYTLCRVRVAQVDHEGLAFVTLESNHANRPYSHNARCRRSALKNACRHAGDRLLILIQRAGNDEAVLAHDGTPCHTHFFAEVPQDFFHCASSCSSRALSAGACPYKERRAFCLSFHCRDDEMQVNCREAPHPDTWTQHCLHVDVQGTCVLQSSQRLACQQRHFLVQLPCKIPHARDSGVFRIAVLRKVNERRQKTNRRYYCGSRNNEVPARGRRAFWSPGPQMGPAHEALYLHAAQRHSHF